MSRLVPPFAAHFGARARAGRAQAAARVTNALASATGAPASRPLWIRCLYCPDFWCQKHRRHAFECRCPPIEELDFDPYAEGWPTQ